MPFLSNTVGNKIKGNVDDVNCDKMSDNTVTGCTEPSHKVFVKDAAMMK